MCTFFVGILTLGIPICMIIFGALYLNDCPLNKWIPIYLLVGGMFIILIFLIPIFYKNQLFRNPWITRLCSETNLQ